MKQFVLVCIGVFVVSLFMLAAPVGALQLSGYVHSDYGWTSPREKVNDSFIDFQVRYNLREKKEFDNGVFIEVFSQVRAQTTFGASGAAPVVDANVRDAWVKIGTKKLEFQWGRFEKITVLERGEDTFVPEVESEAANVRYRALVDSVMGRGIGDLALRYKFNPDVTFELGGTCFPTIFTGISNTDAVEWGVRPVLQYQTKAILAKTGAEFKRRQAIDSEIKAQRDTIAGGGTLQYTFPSRLVVGAAGAHRIDLSDDDAGVRIGEVYTTTGGAYTKIPVGEKDTFNLAVYYTDWEFDKLPTTGAAEKSVFADSEFDLLPVSVTAKSSGLTDETKLTLTHVYGSYIHVNPLKIENSTVALGVGYVKVGKDEDVRGVGAIIRFTYVF
jgi:hypothetical protein